jgi:hypothetical protein
VNPEAQPVENKHLNYDLGMKLATFAMLPLVLTVHISANQVAPQPPPKPAPAQPPTSKPTPTQRPRPATASGAPVTVTVTVTDQSGAPLSDVRVNLTGSIDRSGSTQTDGTIRFDGLRPGTYRLRFTKDEFITFEREVEVRAGQPAPTPSVALAAAPPAPKPPPPPQEPKAAPLPPPGKSVSISLSDFIERNFITSGQPQKVSSLGCSGLANTVLWQIREPWNDRSNEGADAMMVVIAGDGTLRLDGRDITLTSKDGSFASIPRGTTYSLTRRGRNPLIVLATLVGEPCAP